MKKIKFLLLILSIILLPSYVFAMPAFPMAFWGTVTLNGASAPVGTIVKAYYGDTLAGEITVNEEGIYGYTEATKQKLLVAEGDGSITFKVEQASFNNGAETTGDVLQIHSGFVSGETINQNFAFIKNTSSSHGGGGGNGGSSGGSSSSSSSQKSVPLVTPTLPTPQVIPQGCLASYAFSPITGEKCPNDIPGVVPTTSTLQSGAVLGAETFNFTLLLKTGSHGSEVLELQKFLNGKGYDCGTPDGAFGPKTKAAVIKLQAANNLAADGIVGALTRVVLNK